MATEKDRPQRHAFEGIARDILSSAWEEVDRPLPPEAENLLWDYAMGLLDPPEEERALRLIARSEQAEQHLARIRRSMSKAGLARPIEAPEPVETLAPVEAAVQRVAEGLAAMGRELSFVAAVVVRMGEGLVSALGAPDLGRPVPALQPVLMGQEAAGPTAAPAERIDIAGEGLHVTVVGVPTGRIDLLVKTSPPAEGRVKLWRLRPEAGEVGEEDTGIDGYLNEQGQALLRDCPDQGVYRIVVPDGRQMVICMELGQS